MRVGVIRVPGRVIHLDVDRLQIAASTPVSHTLGIVTGPHLTPDGRFLLWSGSNVGWFPAPHHVSLFDIARREQPPPLAASDLTLVRLAVHPSEMRAFLGLTRGPVTVAEPGHTYTPPSPPCAEPWFLGRSGDGRRLSYVCPDPLGVVVVDSADGRLIGTVPTVDSAWSSSLLDDAGTTMFAFYSDWEGYEPVFKRFDVATGALLAERQGGPGFDGALWHYNPATGHVYAGTQGAILVLDANTLQEVGRIPTPSPSLPFAWMALDPDRPEAYIGWHRRFDNRSVVRVSLVHTGTFATIGSYDIPIDGEFVGMALGPRPPRVSDLGALVDGRLVTLSWRIDASRSIATEQVVEVGLAPGQTVIRLPVAADASSLAVPDAPSGRFYVRIRSMNGTGLGTPSNEVIVDVP